jgi:hypothetical protein
MSGRLMMQLNAMVGVASSAAASAIIWLVLTQPAKVAVTVAQGDYDALALAVAHQLGAWVRALLWFV